MSLLGDFQAEALNDTDETDKLQISNETRKLVRTLTILQDYISEYDQLFEQTFFERDRSCLPLIRYTSILVHYIVSVHVRITVVRISAIHCMSNFLFD